MKSKKGLFFPLLFILTLVVLTVLAFSITFESSDPPSQYVGAQSLKLEKTYQEVENIRFYLDKSLQLASQEAVEVLAKNGGFPDKMSCFTHQGSADAIMTGNTIILNTCKGLDLQSNLVLATNKIFNQYKSKYKGPEPSNSPEIEAIIKTALASSKFQIALQRLSTQQVIATQNHLEFNTTNITLEIEEGEYYKTPNLIFKTPKPNLEQIKKIFISIRECKDTGLTNRKCQENLEREYSKILTHITDDKLFILLPLTYKVLDQEKEVDFKLMVDLNSPLPNINLESKSETYSF